MNRYGTFNVLVDKKEIYAGDIIPFYSSTMGTGPIINCEPALFNDYIIPICFNQLVDIDENSIEDPRSD